MLLAQSTWAATALYPAGAQGMVPLHLHNSLANEKPLPRFTYVETKAWTRKSNLLEVMYSKKQSQDLKLKP